MGITSLSHLGVVALVIAIMAIIWKVRKRQGQGRPLFSTASGAQGARPQWIFFKATALIALFLGAMTPMFRTDGAAPIVHMVATLGLTALAGLWLFRK